MVINGCSAYSFASCIDDFLGLFIRHIVWTLIYIRPDQFLVKFSNLDEYDKRLICLFRCAHGLVTFYFFIQEGYQINCIVYFYRSYRFIPAKSDRYVHHRKGLDSNSF